MDDEDLKKKAAYKAADFIESGMTVGLGTGSTVKYFIERLVQKSRENNLKIQTVSSSFRSLKLALEGGLQVSDIETRLTIDITVDGADEIDKNKRMIKGGGGALLREKILASMSRELVVIVDESKKVSLLGHRKLPVEVVPFAGLATLHKIKKPGLNAQFRKKENSESELYVTDNGNYIIDIKYDKLLEDPEREHALLKEIPGVVETGFFFRLAGRVITAYRDGQVIVTP